MMEITYVLCKRLSLFLECPFSEIPLPLTISYKPVHIPAIHVLCVHYLQLRRAAVESVRGVAEDDGLLSYKGPGGKGVTEILSSRLSNEPVLVSPSNTEIFFNPMQLIYVAYIAKKSL